MFGLAVDEHARDGGDEEITQEDAWAVISSFFEQKGLVRQQLDSFNEFVSNTMQEIVDEAPEITVRPEAQHNPGAAPDDGALLDEPRELRIRFGQIFLSKPLVTEPDGETASLFPKEARLRNLTYSAPMYVNLEKAEWAKNPETGEWEHVGTDAYDKVFLAKVRLGLCRAFLCVCVCVCVCVCLCVSPSVTTTTTTTPKHTRPLTKKNTNQKKVPIMLRSQFCSLADQPDAALAELGEDPYDQGGYFVINGSEKVLIAQERMAANHVYVFRKSQPSKYAYVAECRSVVEGSTRGGSGISVKLLAPKSGKAAARGGGGSGSVLRASIPYIKADIPILILFRALGCVVSRVFLFCFV